jgi:hypothetical protein
MILYQTEDGRTRIECRFAGETVWLTQAMMAELFQTTPQNITQHLREIYAEGELDEPATCKASLQVRTEGTRQVSRNLHSRFALRLFDKAGEGDSALLASGGASSISHFFPRSIAERLRRR